MSRSFLSAAAIESSYLEEPLLRFCEGTAHDPAAGLTTFGPFTLSRPGVHPSICRVAVVGAAESAEAARSWLLSCADGVDGEGAYPTFPGCTAEKGFFVELTVDVPEETLLTRKERQAVKALAEPRARFEAALALLDAKLRWLASQDRRPDYVVLALPEDFVALCEVVDYFEGRQPVHRDLRRAIKAMAMRHRLATQLLRERTVRGGKGVDHRSRCAWNFFTAMYFKLGGMPWAPVGLPADTLYVGVSFYRPLGVTNRLQTSVARAFNGRGDALVLRGEEFPWEPTRENPSPHLDGARAERLMRMVLERYADETMGPAPRRVVVHKSSRFTPEEAEGFQSGMGPVRVSDLVAITPNSSVRLLRAGSYPPLRGTHFRLGEIDFLYTTGYLPQLEAFPHGHVPSPLQIADHHGGDTPTTRLLEELLILTKMNWNSANFGGLLPITLRSTRLVGEILREVPASETPLPNFKYYV